MNIDLGMADPWLAHETAPQRNSTLREFLTICFHDRWRIGLAFLLPFLITVVISFIPSVRYTSEASLLVRLGREYFYKPETGDGSTATPVAFDSKETLRAEVEILNSLDIKAAVLQQMGPEKVFPWLVKEGVPKEEQARAALSEMNKRFEARLLKESNIIQLSFTHRDGAVAAKVLSQVIETYLDRRRSIFANGGHESAQEKVNALSSRLNAVEERLSAFKQEHGILAFGEQQSLLLGRQNTLDVKLDESAVVLAQSGARGSSLQASMDFLAPEVVLSKETQRSDAVENARRVLMDLQLKERDLSAKFSAETPAVQDARGAVARAQGLLDELLAKPSQIVRTGRNTVRENVESDWLRTRADSGQAGAGVSLLRQQRQLVDQKLNTLSATQRQLVALERERKLLEVSFEAAVRRLEDALVQDELDRTRKSNVSIV